MTPILECCHVLQWWVLTAICTIQLCSCALVIGTEVGTSVPTSAHCISFPRNWELILVRFCWFYLTLRANISHFGHGMWKSLTRGGGWNHCKWAQTPENGPSRDSSLDFQWLSTCSLHWVHVQPCCTFFPGVSSLHSYNKLPLFYFGLSGCLCTQNQSLD